MRVLVAAIGSLVGSGYATRVDSMIRAYTSRGWDVDLLHARNENEARASDDVVGALRAYVELVLPPVRRADHLSLLPPAVRVVRSHLQHGLNARYDVAQAESSVVWPVIDGAFAGAKILVLHDDDARRYTRMAREARDPARVVLRSATAVRFASYQRRAVRAADRVWFVSPRELDRMAYARGKARLVPNGATADLFTVPPPHCDRPVATFVGPASYDANRRAVEQLLGRIWPLVSRRVPGAELRLVGSGWRQMARTHPDVIDRGFVPDLSAELRAATIALAPLRSGAGTKIKVLEAMAAARPVVATRIAAEGIPPSPGLRVEDDPGAFADAAASWLAQPETARAAGEANRTAVRGQEWSAIWAEAIVELEQLVQRRRDGASAHR